MRKRSDWIYFIESYLKFVKINQLNFIGISCIEWSGRLTHKRKRERERARTLTCMHKKYKTKLWQPSRRRNLSIGFEIKRDTMPMGTACASLTSPFLSIKCLSVCGRFVFRSRHPPRWARLFFDINLIWFVLFYLLLSSSFTLLLSLLYRFIDRHISMFQIIIVIVLTFIFVSFECDGLFSFIW